jgi:hypothetical protein
VIERSGADYLVYRRNVRFQNDLEGAGVPAKSVERRSLIERQRLMASLDSGTTRGIEDPASAPTLAEAGIELDSWTECQLDKPTRAMAFRRIAAQFLSVRDERRRRGRPKAQTV